MGENFHILRFHRSFNTHVSIVVDFADTVDNFKGEKTMVKKKLKIKFEHVNICSHYALKSL